MFSYSHFETFALFLGALTVVYCTYDEVVKRLAKEPEKPETKPHIRPQNKQSGTVAQPVVKKALYQRFEVDNKGSKEVKQLTSENFEELLSGYFIATDYLLQLWIEHPFNLILTDNLQKHFGKDIKLEGFIRHNDIPDIFIKLKASSKFKTGILLHELSHNLANKEAKQKNIRTTSHGPLFKKYMRLLFKPLLLDKTYYRKHHELSYHLAYESNRHTPTRDMCV
jgi:hypothetical protein